MRSSPLRRWWLAAAVAVPALCPALRADDAPAWLDELRGVKLPAYDAKVNAVVLLNEEHTMLMESGRLSTVTRTAIKYLTTQGDVIFYDQYDANSGKVREFRAWMISPSGRVKKYGKEEILDVACVDNDVYNECRRRMVSGRRDADTGAIFAYESTVEYESFSNQLLFHFQESSPVRLARFVVTLPAGCELKAASFNGAPREAVSGGTYTWQMENLPALEPEDYSPSYMSLTPWVGVNLLGPGGKRAVLTWPDAAKLLAELSQGQSEPNEAMVAKARSLVEGIPTELGRIRAIGRFAQQLNYVSIQLNVSKGGGYRPHPASQIYEKLYGDCKDKANLTRAMLKAVGITAYPVAIFSGDRTHVSQDWPSLGAFNHAISAIRVGPDTAAPAVLDHPRLGRLLFFDPTDPYAPAGLLPGHEQASLALVGAADGGDLVRVPAGIAAAADRERQVDAVLAADGSLTGNMVEKRTGEALAGAVSEYRTKSADDFRKTIERWVAGSIPSAATSGIEVTDGEGEFVLKARFASNRFAKRPQPRMLIFSAALLDYEHMRLSGKTRKYPVVVESEALSERVRIRIPEEFRVDELPEPVRIQSQYGKYEALWAAENGSITFKRVFEMNAQTVPAAQYSELRAFLDAVAGAADAPVVLVGAARQAP